MRVLVCGGRGYWKMETLRATLDAIHEKTPIAMLITGGAAGADTLAAAWAQGRGLLCVVYRAIWTLHGKAAGPIRNQQMLEDGKPDIVVAFPGGTGTADMVRRSRGAGVNVLMVPA